MCPPAPITLYEWRTSRSFVAKTEPAETDAIVSMTPPSPSTRSTISEAAPADDEERIQQAIALAGELLHEAKDHEADSPRGERSRKRRMAAIVGNPHAQAFTMALTDEVARIGDRRRSARRFEALVGSMPLGSLSVLDRTLLRLGAVASRVAPGLVMRVVDRRLRRESAGVVIAAEDRALTRHLAARKGEGIRSNVNVLGEAILSEAEAHHRLHLVLEQLARADVDYVSVKISAICAHVSPLAFDATVSEVGERIRQLFRAANRSAPAKFVNLDMEEYRDLALTTVVFRKILDEPEFHRFSAGIVLQAYLPDSHAAARELCAWARRRVETGGAAIKIRLVKGANLAMEQVEAELRGWASAPFATKHEVDASYKAMLDLLLDEANDDSVRVGLASHNVFDLAWGLLERDRLEERGRADRIDFEMLEGMASAHALAVERRAGSLLLYSPIVSRHDFPAAIAYLVRRLDENTAPENFLTSLFRIEPGNEIFREQAARFTAAVRARGSLATTARRHQDRRRPSAPDLLGTPFHNDPDTDFTLAANQAWIIDALRNWQPPTRPPVADVTAVDAAVARALGAQLRWASKPAWERAVLVNRVGDAVTARRGEILATMAHEAGKPVGEGDPEISEAIDFARYYARAAVSLDDPAGAAGPSTALGTVVITPPWNFPFAIPLGGVLAALAAGNAVVLKPAPQTVLTAVLVAECCWAAGISPDVLQLVACPDDQAGTRLITHPDIDAVILTGANATARMFLEWRPELRLHAETSGKNAMVITATADLDAAIRDLVRSAFGHAGQKCSAASLAIVEASLYDDASFRRRLHDAVVTLRVGAALDLTTDVGPLIDPPGDALRRALTTLETGESWLVEPRCLDGDRLWTPGVRLGVRPGSWFAVTECFGPVLGIIRADDLDDAIVIQNSSNFGLTAGLHALDPGEIDQWCERVEAGNLYVNRGMTGAIVQRQPFGGWKQSVVGPTVKAGGPAYVASLRHWPGEPPSPTVLATLPSDFDVWALRHARVEHDPTALRAESNVYRLRPLGGGVALRLGANAPGHAAAVARAAARATGCRLVISSHDSEPEDAFASRLGGLGVDRLRIAGSVGPEIRRAAHRAGVVVDDRPLVVDPTVELPRWLREQVVTRTMHRHGRLSPVVGGGPG